MPFTDDSVPAIGVELEATEIGLDVTGAGAKRHG